MALVFSLRSIPQESLGKTKYFWYYLLCHQYGREMLQQFKKAAGLKFLKKVLM
jgi:hypothetical protein